MVEDKKASEYTLGLILTRFFLAFLCGLFIDFLAISIMVHFARAGHTEPLKSGEEMLTMRNILVAIPIIWGVFGIFFFDRMLNVLGSVFRLFFGSIPR